MLICGKEDFLFSVRVKHVLQQTYPWSNFYEAHSSFLVRTILENKRANRNLGERFFSKIILFYYVLLRHSWHTILYWFQVYNIMNWHLYTLWIDNHEKSSNAVAIQSYYHIIIDGIPCAIITLCGLFILEQNFIPLNPFHLHRPPLHLSPTLATTILSVSFGQVLFCLFILFCRFHKWNLFCRFHKWHHLVFVFPSDLFHLV